jgi:hypothetical protein
MPLVSFANRDMVTEPFTVGELIKILSEFPKEDELRFMGERDEEVFFRFKYRGEHLLTMELREANPDIPGA